MDANGLSFFEWLLGGIVTIIASGASVILHLFNGKVDDIGNKADSIDKKLDNHATDLQNHKLDVANYKLEVSKEYAKEASVQATVARVHDRLDEIQTDIKTLIAKVGK